MQNELSKIVEQEVTIPAKVHFRFVASSRQVVKEIEKNCGGVHIKFPAEKSNSDKVSVRGPKDDVAKAVEELKKVSKRFQETAFEDSIQAKTDYHKFFIGRKGAKINELTAKYPSIRVVFPREDAADKEKIHFLGSKEDVAAVKKIFEKQITELNEKTEVGVEVDPKHHSHFVARYAQVLNSIQKDFCGVVISFPKKGTDDKNVTIKGAKQAVEGAKQRILEIVDDLENQVIISMDIEAKHRPSFFRDLGDKTTRVQVVEDEFNVQIKFPPRPPKTAEGKPVPPTESEMVDDEVKISGRAENCEKAKEALLAFVPIKKTVEVSLDLHRGLIGEKGAIVNSISQAHHVRIIFPKNDEQKDAITIEGVASDVEEATKTVLEHIERLEKEAEDKKLKSFRLDVVIDPKHHQRLIGIRGANVNKIREAHDVRISFPDTRHKDADDRKPRKDFRDPNAGPDVIIRYEAACKEVEKIFLDDVEKYESQYTEEVELDPRFHPKLIGRQSQNLKKLQSEYEVEIRILVRRPRTRLWWSSPAKRTTSADASSVSVSTRKISCRTLSCNTVTFRLARNRSPSVNSRTS
ncbi:hypothetical protein L596_015620 [Steinernema carpocapsae]|uniref:K Homology domain-containing protein n=1 Tax=Steinernema carpocapsae TaxID=34508 RepID=A0A4U5NG57_STECR|nr:hypothetical protein L596_015620 [Steinernema carpocapsae]